MVVLDNITKIKQDIAKGERIIQNMNDKIAACTSIRNKVIDSNFELSERLEKLNILTIR